MLNKERPAGTTPEQGAEAEHLRTVRRHNTNAMLAEGGKIGKRSAKRFTGKLTEMVLQAFKELSEKELQAVIKTASQYSTTNCGWSEYRMKDVIVNFATDILKWKKERRKLGK